jgi:ribosomal protein S18 acetylase RimI-like enzyme
MHPLKITPATKADLPEILRLYENVLDKNRPIISIETAQQLFQKMAQYPDYQLYVAKLGTEIIGTFALLIMDNLAHFGTPSAIVEDVAVAEKYQSQGVGREMMAFALQKAKEKGCYKLVLSSNKNRTEAHVFYEKLGFEKHGYSFVVE